MDILSSFWQPPAPSFGTQPNIVVGLLGCKEHFNKNQQSELLVTQKEISYHNTTWHDLVALVCQI